MELTLLKEPIRVRVLSPIPHTNFEGKVIYYQGGDYITVNSEEELKHITAPEYPFKSQLDLSNLETKEINEGALNVTREHKPLNIHKDVNEAKVEGVETYSIKTSGEVGEVTTVTVLSTEAPTKEVPVEEDQQDDQAYLETQERLFSDSLSSLQEEYAGQYVCFEDGEVLAYGSSFEEVASKVINKEGKDRTLFIEKVEEPEEAPKPQTKTERRKELANLKASVLKDTCISYGLTYTNKVNAVKDILEYEFGEAQ